MNTDLLVKTLHHIDANRTDWQQGSWRTCFAGHAAVLAGGEWAFPDSWALKAVDDDKPGDVFVYGPEDGCDVGPVRGVVARDRATRVLGLSASQAHRLFHCGNDLHRLHVIVSELCSEAAA